MTKPLFKLSILTAALLATSVQAQTYEFRTPNKGLVVTPTSTAPTPAPAPAPTPSPAPAPTKVLSVSTSTLSFDELLIGSSQAKQLLVENKGTGTVTVETPTLSGSPDFNAISQCPGSLAAGGSCVVEVTFTPTTRSGSITGSLTIPSNATTPLPAVTLQGSSYALTGELTANTDTVFGDVEVNTAAIRVFTFRNTGDKPLSGVAASITGAGYSLDSNTCGTAAAPGSLLANQTCSITVRFQPTVLGSSAGTLSVASSATNTPSTLSLTGKGVGPADAAWASVRALLKFEQNLNNEQTGFSPFTGLNVQYSSVAKFGTRSAGFIGGAGINVPAEIIGPLANTQTTVEMFVRPTSLSTANSGLTLLIGNYYVETTNGRWQLSLLRTGTGSQFTVSLQHTTATNAFGPTLTLTAPSNTLGTVNAWNHVAMSINATTPNAATVYLSLNGSTQMFTNVPLGSHTVSNPDMRIASGAGIQRGGTQATYSRNDLLGQIDEFRVTRAVRYTGAYTVPTEQFPNR